MRNILLVLLVILGPLSWAHRSAVPTFNPICEDLLTETALTEKQIFTLLMAQAHTDELEFRILSKPIGRQKYSIVLMGENHFPTKNDLGIGTHVALSFHRFATENGSTNTSGQKFRHRLLPLAALTAMPGMLMQIARGRVPLSPMLVPKTRGHQVENAELGHQPTLAEELNLLGFAVVEATVSACVGVCAYSLAHAAWTGEIASNALVMSIAGGLLYLKHRIYDPLLIRHKHRMPIAASRDRTIARNLNKLIDQLATEEHESDGYRWELHPVYLVILGSAHLPNTAEHLTKEYGFTESRLPGSRD